MSISISSLDIGGLEYNEIGEVVEYQAVTYVGTERLPLNILSFIRLQTSPFVLQNKPAQDWAVIPRKYNDLYTSSSEWRFHCH